MYPTNQIPAQGLYDPEFERDACGVAWLVNQDGTKTHKIVSDSLTALRNLLKLKLKNLQNAKN